MKRCLLLVMAILVFCKTACAENINPIKMTVKQFYDLNFKSYRTENERLNGFVMTGYLYGIRDFNSVRYILNDNMEIVDCIYRPITVWVPLVFDKYKLNKIKGDDVFYLHFIKTIEEVCNVDLMKVY